MQESFYDNPGDIPQDEPFNIPDEVVDKYLAQLFKAGKEHHGISEEEEHIINQVRFRLAGYLGNGERTDLHADARESVKRIERTLAIDPDKIAKEFKKLPKALEAAGGNLENLDKNKFSFIRKGGHLNVNSLEKLKALWREGFIIIAELPIEDADPVPLGYIYGLDETPYSKRNAPIKHPTYRLHPDYPNLDIRDLVIRSDIRKDMIAGKENRIAVWRTGVAERISDILSPKERKKVPSELLDVNLRRLGIGTALKHVAFNAAQKRGKTDVTLNVGQLQMVGAKKGLSMPNAASLRYNSHFMETLGWRERYYNEILGKNHEHFADMRWFALQSELDSAINRMEKPGGILLRKDWNIERLYRDAMAIRLAVADAVHRGIHSGTESDNEYYS